MQPVEKRRAALAGDPIRKIELQPAQNSNPDRRAQYLRDRFRLSPHLAAVVCELAFYTTVVAS